MTFPFFTHFLGLLVCALQFSHNLHFIHSTLETWAWVSSCKLQASYNPTTLFSTLDLLQICGCYILPSQWTALHVSHSTLLFLGNCAYFRRRIRDQPSSSLAPADNWLHGKVHVQGPLLLHVLENPQ